jgi:UPF0755 protein
MVKKLGYIIIALIFVGICSVGILYMLLMSWADRPVDRVAQEKLFTISSGQGLKETAHALQREGLVSDALRFTILARLDKKDKLLKAGEYFFSTAMTPQGDSATNGGGAECTCIG